MPHRSISAPMQRATSWARNHRSALIIVGAALLLLAVGIFDGITGAKRRDDILFLAQVGGLVFLAVYVIATNRIAQANQRAAQATSDSATAARQAVEAALRSIQVSEAMLAEARATRQAQEMQTAPRVVVYPELDDLTIYLVIENTGLSFANEVTVAFTPELPPNTFPTGFMPDFFTGGVFTLKPGQKIRQPLAQDYRPPFNLNGPLPQTATVRYRGGAVSDYITETFPINISGFDKILVTRSDVDLALDKLDGLIKAVDNTGKAVMKVVARLDGGLGVSVSVTNPAGQVDGQVYLSHFQGLVGALASEWQLWADNERARFYMRPVVKQHLRILTDAALATLPYLPVSQEMAHRLRALLFDIQATQTSPFPSREDGDGDAILSSLADLTKLVEEIGAPRESDTGATGPGT